MGKAGRGGYYGGDADAADKDVPLPGARREGVRVEQTQARLRIPHGVSGVDLTGPGDAVMRVIEEKFPEARIVVTGDAVEVRGGTADVQALTALFTEAIMAAQEGAPLTRDAAERLIETLRTDARAPSALRDDVLLTYRGRAIRPKTSGQKRYVDAMRANTITFGIGPAGSGKTYLAMAMAVAALKRKAVGRIVLTRPVVEAGESLGFLPGTLEEKVDPYVRPLYDALFDMTDPERSRELLETGVIEIAPLAFMRGRTLNDAFVILDEAQNTTPEQMKMFLTRLGFGSRFVITGDLTQTDLPGGRSSLRAVRDILRGIDGIAFCDLTSADVVRHSLVAKIVTAYDEAQERAAHARDLRQGRAQGQS